MQVLGSVSLIPNSGSQIADLLDFGFQRLPHDDRKCEAGKPGEKGGDGCREEFCASRTSYVRNRDASWPLEWLLIGDIARSSYHSAVTQSVAMRLLLAATLIAALKAAPPLPECSIDDDCASCTIGAALAAPKIDVEPSSYLVCSSESGVWKQEVCSENGRAHFSASLKQCIDPATMIFHAQGTSGSGRVGDVCSFNTDCLGGMFCAIGQCRCLSTYIAVDAYCYEKISPSDSGCFYDVQCSAVWPDSFCKNGQCLCPSDDMVAIKTKDGTLCVWSTSTEPACPLPSLPPPDSPAALTVLPAAAGKNSVSIAPCNPHSSTLPNNEETLLNKAYDHKCAVRGSYGDEPSPIDVSDIYDCIDNSKFWKEQGVDTSQHPVGVCCMNRAFTCMQPKRGESEALGSVPRWYFNAVIGSCQQFLFDPTSSEVSPNNFETLDHCESYCKDTCPRGNPSYLAAKSHLGQSAQTGCTTANPCPDPFVCTEVASQSVCCPSRKSICSEAGARSKDPLRPAPYDPGHRFDQLTGEAANYALGISTRFAWRLATRRNVLLTDITTIRPTDSAIPSLTTVSSEISTISTCNVPHGNPLTNGNGAPQRCQRDTDCPSTHTCATEHTVCCPTAQTLCTEPLRVGDCKQSVRQFWYNAETRTCESFLYTGCQGNNNRFNSLNECQSYCRNINAEPKCSQGRAYVDFSGKFMQCGEGIGGTACPANYECVFDGLVHGCCPSKAYTCSLQVNKGVACGSGSSYRYFYNNQAKECQSFLFLGCDGNSNNFPSIEKCQNYCEIACQSVFFATNHLRISSVCPNGGSPLRSNSKVRSCSAADPCPTGYDCSMVDANGVTQRRCCPSKVSICSKPPQMGMLPKCSSGSGQIKYYFNMALQLCSSYTSNGCDTSINSFNSLGECEDFCMSAGCALGDTIYKDPNTNRPFICNTALQNNCPLNYDCTLNALTQEHMCCGSESMGVCPTGEKAFMDPRTNTPRQCAMAADGKCPGGYLCRFSQTNHKYYCCGNINGIMCPAGRSLFRYSTTQLPLQCHISPLLNSCPNSYSCMSDVPGAFQGYCCSQHPICPGEVQFHVDEKSQMPTTCSSDSFAFCPQGFTCQQQPETSNFFCCAGQEKEGVNDGCPPSQFAFVEESGEVKSCDPFDSEANSCPIEYTCQWSLKNQKYQCCGTRPIRNVKPMALDDGCPTKQFALIDRRNNMTRVCTAGEEKSCPVGFFCQFSSKKGQFQCCGQSGGCPGHRAAYIAVDGNAQECLPGPDMCADGYECVKSTNSKKNICCSKEENDCAENELMINGVCRVRVKPGGGCQRDDECVGGSSCLEHVCTCPPHRVDLKGECVDKDCSKNQIRIEGRCEKRAVIGEQCKNSLQCSSNSKCLEGVCDCGKGEAAEGNTCVKTSEKSSNSTTTTSSSIKSRPSTTSSNICSDKNEKPLYEKGSSKLLTCSLEDDDDCPNGFSCESSDVAEQTVCCGRGPEEKSKKVRPTKTTQHCPTGMAPYLVNGRAKSCASSSCPYGYQCKFSVLRKDYYCCSKQHKKTSSSRIPGGGCERGMALLYPSTQEPVQCDPLARGCPHGYLCLPHLVTKRFQCCSVDANRDRQITKEEVEVECPSYMVKVEKEVEGTLTTACAKSCPEGHQPVDRVCRPTGTSTESSTSSA
ncbi:unnamed protein product [Caenorhabditis auriculariae]|uniref:BPTI/Kunitz inhibitor domain-containing protein n=1 Tax=Caenorhabditis auriculariae TaxID=2777116 RepID=A0A8S1HEY8_9PELO|nr:unnamed protein product [Caenorhabditis auriculariae]